MKQAGWLCRLLGVVVVGLTVLLAFIGLEVVIAWHCDLQSQISPPAPQPEERKEATAIITNYLRPEDDTYLSYPEWYIVWSYQEKADFREKTIGKLSELSAGGKPVAEDDYAYKVVWEYADFVHIRPFYEFHFARHIAGLWRETPIWGEHLLRKLERKVFLTADYIAEAFYCWLIEKATHLTYGHEPDKAYAWIDDIGESSLANISSARVVKQAGPRAFIAELPRYQEFSTVAAILAQRQVHFVEIAGNAHIIVSVLGPQSWNYNGRDGRQLFSCTVFTHP